LFARPFGRISAFLEVAFRTNAALRPNLGARESEEAMRAGFVAGLVLVGSCGRGYAAEPSRFAGWGAAGLAGASLEAVHLAGGFDYSPKPFLSIGSELAYSYLPLASNARGGGNRAYWGLFTLNAAARPKARVSPYLTLAVGPGMYQSTSSGTEWGLATAAGAGLRVRLGGRASLFLESRLALLHGITAADGLHGEFPIRVGVRFGL
jgi:hypothetical protein